MSSKATYIGGAFAVAGLLYYYSQSKSGDDDGNGGGDDGSGGYNPPTKENPGGGNTELPPGNPTDPTSQPIGLIPVTANTSYQTSTSDYPKAGFCGVNIGLRSGGEGVAWGPLMAPYDTMAKCFGRQEVRDAARTYMSNSYFSEDTWKLIAKSAWDQPQLIWVTQEPTGMPSADEQRKMKFDARGAPLNLEWPDRKGCFYYDPNTAQITHAWCPKVIPMGKPESWGAMDH